MDPTARRWLDYAWEVVNCPAGHFAECEAAGGARAGAGGVDGNELRWPGYLGRDYEFGKGLLCVAHAHRQPTAEKECGDRVLRETNTRLIAATRAWKEAGVRSETTDQIYLQEVRAAYETGLLHWDRWSAFAGVVADELGLDVTHVAFANLAKCRVPIERSPDRLVRLCQRQFPVHRLVDAIRPVAVLTCVLPARRGGTVVARWDTDNAAPWVVAWHGRRGVDAEGRPMSEWVPEAGRLLRRLLNDEPVRTPPTDRDFPEPSPRAASFPPTSASRAAAPKRSGHPPVKTHVRGDVDPTVLARTRKLMKSDQGPSGSSPELRTPP